MKKQMLRKSLCFLSVMTLAAGMPQLFGCGGPNITLDNQSDTGCDSTNPGIFGDFVDKNLDLRGINAIAGYVSIQAVSCDVTVLVNSGEAIITGSGNRCDGVPSVPARLYLYADTGRSITFDLQSDLIFRGSADGSDLLDLMVTVSGGGQVVFQLADGVEVSFTNGDASNGGTHLFVGMDDADFPTLLFTRGSSSSAGDVNITVGSNSQVSFISPDGVDGHGAIAFDPSNSDVGQMYLNLQDCSSFNIEGHQLDASLNSRFVLTDIVLSVIQGFPTVSIVNGSGEDAAYLRVVNEIGRAHV